MATSPMPFITPEQYLELEERAEFKSEYVGGGIYAMAGGSPAQSFLSALLITVLNNQLRGRCHLFTSDLLVGVSAGGPFFYPDITVVCGAFTLIPGKNNVVANPPP